MIGVDDVLKDLGAVDEKPDPVPCVECGRMIEPMRMPPSRLFKSRWWSQSCCDECCIKAEAERKLRDEQESAREMAHRSLVPPLFLSVSHRPELLGRVGLDLSSGGAWISPYYPDLAAQVCLWLLKHSVPFAWAEEGQIMTLAKTTITAIGREDNPVVEDSLALRRRLEDVSWVVIPDIGSSPRKNHQEQYLEPIVRRLYYRQCNTVIFSQNPRGRTGWGQGVEGMLWEMCSHKQIDVTEVRNGSAGDCR